MKKNILNPLLFIATLFLFIITNTVQAQSVNKIIISVKEIKYDDPNFAALRESLKKNPKVKLVKPSYSSGVAILSFMYAGEASQLWEEIPKTSKRFFNLDGLEDNAISLNYVNPKQNAGNSTVATNPAQNKTTNKKDCFDCDYFPMCKYDVTLPFGGKQYRGIRREDGSITYYYCENGDVTMKWMTSYNPDETYTEYNPFTNTETILYTQGATQYTLHSRVILKSSTPVGKVWGGESSEHQYFISAKDTSVIMEGVKYNNVIIVFEGRQYYAFYAKGVGLIKKCSWMDYRKMLEEAAFSKGTVDPDIVGKWAVDSIQKNAFDRTGWSIFSPYWQFNADGTGEFSNYADFEPKYSGTKTGIFRWRITEKGVLVLVTVYNGELFTDNRIIKSLPAISINGISYHRQ